MAYWLIKAEPEDYSIDLLAKEGKTMWTGVRNYAARNHLRAMKIGDEAIFYRSMVKPAAVGVARVSSEAVPDFTYVEDATTWSSVEFSFGEKFAKELPSTLLKQTVGLESMVLFRISRLSVQPVTAEEFAIIRSMAY
jgi:predicted RNA-binding protein with PUA-like domain